MESVPDLFTQIVQAILTAILWITGAVILVFVVKRVVGEILFNREIEKNLDRTDRTYLFIKMPSTNEQKQEKMEEFFRSLHRVLPNGAPISLEMASSDQFLRFYITVPKGYSNVIESQLYAQYPEAEIEELSSDYLPLLDAGTAFAQLTFKRMSMYPISTYKSTDEDLLTNLSAMLSKTSSSEQVFIQLALKRVGSRFWQRGWRAFFYKAFGVGRSTSEGGVLASQKVSQDLYRGALRVAYAATDKTYAESNVKSILGLFKVFKGEHNELKKKRSIFPGRLDQAFRARVFRSGDLWTSEELATIYHFPYKGTVVSNVVNTTSKRAPAPDILPREGQVNPKEVSFIGETNYRNERKRFGIKRMDRRRHLYIVGKTGSGKSRMLELLLISDIKNGEGCCLIDPHGDLADELLMFVPEERIKDVVYVNPSDRDFPIGFNPLEPVSDYEARQHLSRFFIAIFKKLFAANWNARMEHLIRYMTLALLETSDSSVLGIPRLLSDTKYRQRVIMQVEDPVVKSFWTNEFAGYNEQFANDAVVPILNKVGQFISNPIIRNIVGQQKNMLDFEAFMNNGNIVIINLSKGRLGDENAALLGSMFITKIQQAALARAKVPEDERRDFYFYVDEFQNFATEAFSSILSEARKYHLDLTIAHQYIAQLPDEVKATAFGNVGSIIAFGIGGDDAAYLAKEFSPVFTPDDMINLNVREMYVKMSVDGKLTQPFSARTLDVPKPTFDYSVNILDHSRMKYGKNRVSVENEISQWTQSSQSTQSNDSSEESFPEPII